MDRKLGIVIVSHKRVDLLRHCIRELRFCFRNLTIPWEIVIVDNQGTPELKEYLRFLTMRSGLGGMLRVLPLSESVSFSTANNLAVRIFGPEITEILLLNDDTLPHEGFIQEMLGVLDVREDVGIVGAKLFYPQMSRIQHAGIGFKDKKPYHLFINKSIEDECSLISRELQAVTFACALIRRELWDKVNGLTEYPNDTESPYNYEDVDFCFKAHEAGYKSYYCADALCAHFAGQTAATIYKKENCNKFLPRLIAVWGDKIKDDKDELESIKIDSPHIIVGVPVCEELMWCWDMFLNSLCSQKINKANISVVFGLNNSGHNFTKKIYEWANLYGKEHGFRNIRFPANVKFNPKHEAIVDSRNLCIEALDDLKGTHLFFWDCDVLLPPDTMKRLLALNTEETPITCAPVYYKDENVRKPMLFKLRKDWEAIERGIAEAKEIDDVDELTQNIDLRVRQVGGYEIYDDFKKGEIVTADGAGMGCTMIRAEVFKKVKFEVDCRGYGTEDLKWFSKANKLGYNIKVDTGIRTVHLSGGYAYD